MAKRKKSDDEPVDIRARNGEHPVITEVLKAEAEDQDPLIGLPLPSLAVRYLFQANIVPLSRFIHIRGMFSSGKTALLMEFMHWFSRYGGGGILVDTENKSSQTMLHGMLGHNAEYIKRNFVVVAQSVEEWQGKYMGFAKKIHEQSDNSKGRVFPVVIGIDSVSAVDIERKLEKVADEGHASAGHPALARNLSEFCRNALAPTLRHYPLLLVITNHLKEEINQMGFGPPKMYAPGGAALDFYPTMILDMKRFSTKPLQIGRAEGQSVRITATKNNLGAPQRYINVNLMWYNEIVPCKDKHGNDTYKNQQFHYWDWHTATIRLLTELQDENNKKLPPGMDPKLPDLLRQVCDLEYKHGTKNADTPLVWSKALGISKQDALPEVEASMVLEQNAKVMGVLHGLLGVNDYAVCDPAVQYREQVMSELAKENISDEPELRAGACRITEDVIPADFDPLGQVS
jgi:RecA/RadA recombinase